MKRIVLFCVVALITATSLFAQRQLQKSSDGNYRIAPDTLVTYENTGIFVAKDAEQYNAFFQQAIDHPGDTIAVGERKIRSSKMKNLVEIYVCEEYTQGILLTGSTIVAVGNNGSSASVLFAWHLFLAALSILCMILCNFSSRIFCIMYALFATAIALVTFFSSIGFIADFPLLSIGAGVMSFMIFAFTTDNKNLTAILSVISLLLMLSFIILQYL